MDVVSDVLSASFGLKDMFKENQKGDRVVGAPKRADKHIMDKSDGEAYGLYDLMKTPADYKMEYQKPKSRKKSRKKSKKKSKKNKYNGGGFW